MIVAMSQSGSAVSSVLQLLQLLVIAYCVAAQLPVCGPPRVPAYGGYHGIATPPYVLGSIAKYYCNPGYQLHGSSRTECIFDPQRGPHWLYPPPFCRPCKLCCNPVVHLKFPSCPLNNTSTLAIWSLWFLSCLVGAFFSCSCRLWQTSNSPLW